MTLASIHKKPVKRIGIIGAGFSGSALAAMLVQEDHTIEILLIEKTNQFGMGEAYRTPYPFHYLNVRVKDMSAFVHEPNHFKDWLAAQSQYAKYLVEDEPLAEQFVPRMLYQRYLAHILENINTNNKIQFIHDEAIDVVCHDNKAIVKLASQQNLSVDYVVLAIGNGPPAQLPFDTKFNSENIIQAWEYERPAVIPKQDPILIVGTGLSMIDSVLTLHHHGHFGKIYALSRHGLLPLHHTDQLRNHKIQVLPTSLNDLTQRLIELCKQEQENDGDWRSIITAIRHEIPSIWGRLTLKDRKRFLRHLLPYWNIHRHRVHAKIADCLEVLRTKKQLEIISGRILKVENTHAFIKPRHNSDVTKIKINWLINCLGPIAKMSTHPAIIVQHLLSRGEASIDELNLGFDVTHDGAIKKQNGEVHRRLFSLGPPTRGLTWECTAVPDIRQQTFTLAKYLLSIS